MADINLTFTMRPSADELAGRAIAGESALKRRMFLTMDSEGKRLARMARDEAPRRTGKYAGSIQHRAFQRGDRIGFEIRSASPLSKWILKGTRPHPITPKGNYPLRFYWAKGPRGPGVYYFWSVNHPGTKPNRFYDRAIRSWIPGVRAGLVTAVDSYAEALGR